MYYGHWTLIERRFTTITEGQIYQSGHLTPDRLLHKPDRLLHKVEEYGIKTVINLATGEDLGADALVAEERVLKKAGVRYVHLPVHDVKADTARAFLEIAADPRNRPLLVHCEHGEGRSVVLAAIYRIEVEGWENDRARRAARLIPSMGSFRSDAKNGRISNTPSSARLRLAASSLDLGPTRTSQTEPDPGAARSAARTARGCNACAPEVAASRGRPTFVPPARQLWSELR